MATVPLSITTFVVCRKNLDRPAFHNTIQAQSGRGQECVVREAVLEVDWLRTLAGRRGWQDT